MLAMVALPTVSPLSCPPGWDIVEARDNFAVRSRMYPVTDSDLSQLMCARGVTVVPAPPRQVADLLLSHGEMRAEWDPLLESSEVVQTLRPGVQVVYSVMRRVGLKVRKRGVLSLQVDKRLDGDVYILLSRSVQHPDRAGDPKGVIRGCAHLSGWLVKPQGANSLVVLLSQFDPCGSIPTKAINSINCKVVGGVSVLHQYFTRLEKRWARDLERLQPPRTVRALYSHTGETAKHMTFKEGDVFVMLQHVPETLDLLVYHQTRRGLVHAYALELLDDRPMRNAGYDRLVKLFLEPTLAVAVSMCKVVTRSKTPYSSRAFYAFIRLFEEQGRAIELLKEVVADEVKATRDETTLLRGQDPASETMSAYASVMGRQYLVDLLRPLMEVLSQLYREGGRVGKAVCFS